MCECVCVYVYIAQLNGYTNRFPDGKGNTGSISVEGRTSMSIIDIIREQ